MLQNAIITATHGPRSLAEAPARPPPDPRTPLPRTLPGARGDASCPNLPQRPGSSRSAREEPLIFRAFLRGRSRPGAPLWQIRTRPHPEPSHQPHQHHPEPGYTQNNLHCQGGTVSMSLSHQEDPRTGQGRRDGAEKSGAKRGVRLLCVPPHPRTHSSRSTTPIPVPGPPVLVRKAQCTYRCVVLPDSRRPSKSSG